MRHFMPAFTALAAASLFAACGDDSEPRPDTSTDTTSDTSTDTTSDTASDTTSDTASDTTSDTASDSASDSASDTASDTSDDTTPDTDTTPGESLEGTALEGVDIRWERALLLCSAWQEGTAIEDEVAHKVRIALALQSRTDLEYASLATAALDGVSVETGPFSNERWRDATPTSTRVVRWQLLRGDGYDAISVELRHDLGPAGVLSESYSLSRFPGAPDDVVVNPDSYESMFYWAPAGTESFHMLQSCETPEDYERAISVMVAGDPLTDDFTATLLRHYDTRHSEISAGSYPVRLQAMQVMYSDDYWHEHVASGPWALTYAAQHHNWGDETRVDFSRDLASWQTVFRPLANEEPIPEGSLARVQLTDVGGGNVGSVTLTRLASDGTPSDTSLRATGEWRRVDENHLGRVLEAACAGGTVGAVGYYDHVAQLMLCPDAAAPFGKRLIAVVPVVWRLSPELAGVELREDAISELSGRPGWLVTIGQSKLVIEPQAGGAFIIDVLNAAGESVGSAWGELMPLTLPQRWGADVDAVGGGASVYIGRFWAAQGVGESAIYAVSFVTMTWGDEAYTVDAWDRVDYVNTHHNWNDTLAATTDDGHVLHWSITYDFDLGLVQKVWVIGPDGEEVLAPTVVEPRP